MKKLILKLLLPILTLGLSSCAFFEFNENEKLVVDMGDGETSVKWELDENLNECRPVQSAYFEMSKTKFKYYEDGKLKKEGDLRAVHHGLDTTTKPLTIRLNFGQDEKGIDVYDELACFTEDEKESVHQFSIMAEGYYVKPLRMGGVPIRDYHLSDMPYAFGTYVKEGYQRKEYKNSDSGKVGDAVKMKGTFMDEAGNNFYFLNNRFFTTEGYYFSMSNTYFRYENNIKDIFIEGTISLTHFDSYEYGREIQSALLRILHGSSEPSKEKGVVLDPDYHLLDFVFTDDDSFSFNKGEYFYENRECSWDPQDFIPSTYVRL